MSLEKTITTRASSGTLTNNFRTGYAVQISWSVNSQNIANNTSNVTVKAQLVSTGSAYTISSSATKNGSLTINGTKYSFTFSAGLSGGQTKTVFTKTVDIPHNSDGTKTFSMSTTLGINVTLSGTYWGNVSKSGDGKLNTIPRTSTISLSASSVAVGSAITVNITRASTAFTHKVYYTFGSKSVTISTSATTSASYTIPTDHATVIPNATSGSATITVDTYNGSTKIGSASKSFTVTVPTSIKPSLTSVTATVVASGADTSYGYVKGKSKVKLTINGATGSQGSTISSYSISGGGFSSSSSSFTTGVLNSSGSITFTATVTDSRGRKSDAKTVSISVQDYANPNITGFTVIRCNSGGTASNDGTYIKITPTYTYTTLGGKNAITSKAEYKQTGGSSWTNAGAITSGSSLVTGANGIATGSSYDVRFTITDNFGSVSRTAVIPTAFMTMDFKKGGKGIAFGKASETDNLVDIGMNLKVSGDGNTQISSTGKSVSWLDGCKGTGAIINMTSQSGYSPILRQKTTNGAWAMGVYTNDTLYLTYMTDTNINNGTNSPTAQFQFPANVSGTVYTTGNKPTPSAIGALPTTGGTLSGAITVSGESKFHNGTYSDPWSGTSCAIKTTGNVGVGGDLKTTGSLNVGTTSSFGQSLTVGSYEEAWRGITVRRATNGQNYGGRYAVSYVNNMKQSSSSTAVLAYGASMECYDGSSAVRRVILCQNSLIPSTDNNTYCGASSHRWQAVYASTGTVYSSSKDEKENITPLNIAPINDNEKSTKDVIKDGIKNTNMYSYSYRAINNNDAYVGFLGQELEEKNKEFFDLIGSSYVTDAGNVQYDIRETSVVGVLWSGLQDALVENEQQEEKIKNLESEVETLKNELQQIKDMLSKIA